MKSSSTLFEFLREQPVHESPPPTPLPALPKKEESQPADAVSNATDSLLLTEREAASLLRISPRKLWEIRMQGQIPFVRIGRAIRYSRDELASWIQDQNRTR